MTRSCIVSPSPAVLKTKTRLPMTTGAERPPKGCFHTRFSPLGDHFSGRFFSGETPSRVGPRHSAQSLPAAALLSDLALLSAMLRGLTDKAIVSERMSKKKKYVFLHISLRACIRFALRAYDFHFSF